LQLHHLPNPFRLSPLDSKSAADAQTYDVSIEQLSLYALGYRDLSGEQADFLEIYNLDENRSHRRELLDSNLEEIRHKIIEAAEPPTTPPLSFSHLSM
jgi:DNA helicase-2/ATP-dependent DNA helicase PcrA